MGTDLHGEATPDSLIPGDPDAIEELARTLAVLARGMGEGQSKLAAIRSGDWRGKGGAAFRNLIGEQPAKFGAASDAFGQARGALVRYADVLRQAQHDAGLALEQYGRSEQATRHWQHGKHHGTDPGESGRSAAHQTLALARSRVDTEARRTANALMSATQGAPKKPSLLHRALSGVEHLLTNKSALGHVLLDVGAGVIDGAIDMAKGAWMLTGAAMTDPAGFARSWEGMLEVVGLPQQRRAFGLSFVDADEWSTDPARALGHTGFTVATTLIGIAGYDAAPAAVLPGKVPPLSSEVVAAAKASEAEPGMIEGYPAWRGLTDKAKWAQENHGALFGVNGTFKYRSVQEVVDDLRSGVLGTGDLKIDVIRRGDNTLIVNTRSSHALMRAGIPRSEWIVRDVTGDERLERRLTAQLKRSNLTESGTDSVWQRRMTSSENARPVGWPYNIPPESEPFDWRRASTGAGLTDFVGSGNATKARH
ncbi:MAG: hypothetical protein J2P17_03495 [Mycobacterium sp.]|nr:hypothetical protein [Mycobacterium sp.]